MAKDIFAPDPPKPTPRPKRTTTEKAFARLYGPDKTREAVAARKKELAAKAEREKKGQPTESKGQMGRKKSTTPPLPTPRNAKQKEAKQYMKDYADTYGTAEQKAAVKKRQKENATADRLNRGQPMASKGNMARKPTGRGK